MNKTIYIRFTGKLYDIIDDIGGPIAEALMRMEGDYSLRNELKIELVDVSKFDWNFDVTINGKIQSMKIGNYIKYFFTGDDGSSFFDRKQIFDFGQSYNNLKNGRRPVNKIDKPTFKKVEIPKFTFNPKDVRSTFISFTTKTYPHGHEEEVVKFLPSGLQKDEFGNYYKIIGKSETMFTSHLDTADRKQSNVVLYSTIVDGDEIFVTDSTSILGADDKSGVAVMLYMMEYNIPGIYYFFIGEERGGIGSNKVADIFENIEHLKNVKRCVSFDRRNYFSVITSQLGRQCCSNEFATALAKELNKSGLKISLDPTGVYTDSASFIDKIPECTNISVGYFSEHTVDERQNISYLIRLAEACLKVDWENLPTVKKVGFDEEVLRKYGKFISDFKAAAFTLETKMVSEYGTAYIKIEVDDPDVLTVYEDLQMMNLLLDKYKIDPDVYFEDQFIKIELK